jgi:hypothetical protein
MTQFAISRFHKLSTIFQKKACRKLGPTTFMGEGNGYKNYQDVCVKNKLQSDIKVLDIKSVLAWSTFAYNTSMATMRTDSTKER